MEACRRVLGLGFRVHGFQVQGLRAWAFRVACRQWSVYDRPILKLRLKVSRFGEFKR